MSTITAKGVIYEDRITVRPVLLSTVAFHSSYALAHDRSGPGRSSLPWKDYMGKMSKGPVEKCQTSQPGKEHPAITHVKAYLQAHYTERVSLQELAEEAHLSPFHLARIFRQGVGLSPHAYQTQLRLERARTLLAQGYDVDYVAHETGFSDQSHFTRQFKHHYQVTPGSYRNTTRFSLPVSLEQAIMEQETTRKQR